MTPLILLPGMMCDARLFAPQMAAIGARDMLVHLPTGQDSMAALAQVVLKEAPERFALGGLSMGGILAMEVFRQAPDRVAGLCLMDTNPLAELPEKQAGRAPQVARAKADLRKVMMDEMIPHYLADGATTGPIPELCLDMALGLGPEAFSGQSLALRDRPDQTETLKEVNVPTLILCGRQDRLCPVERHALMRDLVPGATLTIVDGAGHLPTLETPDAVNAALLNWLTNT